MERILNTFISGTINKKKTFGNYKPILYKKQIWRLSSVKSTLEHKAYKTKTLTIYKKVCKYNLIISFTFYTWSPSPALVPGTDEERLNPATSIL